MSTLERFTVLKNDHKLFKWFKQIFTRFSIFDFAFKIPQMVKKYYEYNRRLRKYTTYPSFVNFTGE